MAGFIHLEDGRGWAASNAGYDAVIDALVNALPAESSEFAQWLGQRTSAVRGTGLGYVDLRELSPVCRSLFRLAVSQALRSIDKAPGSIAADQEWYASWLERFHMLSRMLESVDRMEDPQTLNPYMTGLVPWNGEKSGPGW